jgi:PAS domain S-box-containing protein
MTKMTTILIVDDEPSGRETLAALLHTQGYQLAFAGNGREALAQATALNPDMILLDVMMPEMDGYEVCRRLRGTPRLAEVPIILITALDDRDSRLEGIEAGADDFISKPFDRVELRSRIRGITRLNRYRRLMHERAMFERVVDLSPNGLMIVDRTGLIQLANPAIYRLLGMPGGGELIQTEIWQLIAPEERERWSEHVATVFADPVQTARFETTLITARGELAPIEVDAGPVEWDLQPAAQIIIRDISERKQAEILAQRRIERLSTLRTIDAAIVSSFDLEVILQIILDQAIGQLQADAAAILLHRRPTQTLEYAVVRGLDKSALRQLSLRIGEGCGGYAAQQRRMLRLPAEDGATDAPTILPTRNSQLRAYYGVPLIVKDQVEGVLELFSRTPLDPDSEWLNFLETLAGQAAIAIDRAALFESMQHANIELSLAYDTTLEGWARALELRDIETEGHSRRVAEMTVRLAQALGVSDAELVHVRRGALLHDIGKMGIPDSILLKPGVLTAEEWEVMRRHPTYAYEMLAPIAYFRPALDIPHYHHEKWDGTGYPHGLRGEQIPLAARIFAVVDVWDALCFDRPYRKGWPEGQVHEHIRSLAGTHFDPQVVHAFLRLSRIAEANAQPKVLVVDDDESITHALARGLGDLFTVFTANSGDAALALLEREEIAVILTDQRMPGMTGVELLQQARQIRPLTLGILSSAYIDQNAQAHALELDTVRAYLPKPWSLIELRRQVREVAQQYHDAIRQSTQLPIRDKH